MYAPCKNPHCSKQGQSHPNCHCYDATKDEVLSQEGMERPGHFAEGGEATGCNGPHKEDCEYYLPEDEKDLVHGALVHHGLSNLLRSTSTNLSDDPFKPTNNFIKSSHKGNKKYANDIVDSINGKVKANEGSPKELQQCLDDYKLNPDSALDIGSGLADNFSKHSNHMATIVARAGNYLDTIKPQGISMGALNDPAEPSDTDKRAYSRQLGIVEQPMSVLKHIKTGSILPRDMTTLQTVYPHFYGKIKKDLSDQIISSKAKGKEFSHNERSALATFTGDPYDITSTPVVARAAMAANLPKPQAQNKPKSSRPRQSQASISQQQKVNEMFETPTQSAAQNKKD